MSDGQHFFPWFLSFYKSKLRRNDKQPENYIDNGYINVMKSIKMALNSKRRTNRKQAKRLKMTNLAFQKNR